MSSKENTPFTSFPDPPFHLVCKLKHLMTYKSSHTNDHPKSLASIKSSHFQPNAIIYSSESGSLTPEDDTTSLIDSDHTGQWYSETDTISDSDQNPTQAQSDEASTPYVVLLGAIAESLTRISNSGLKRSGVFGDIWHLMNQFPIPMHHGLRRPFAGDLRDAFFLFDQEDKATIEAFLATKGVTWETMLRYHPGWLFQAFGPLKDAKTGTPFFKACIEPWQISTALGRHPVQLSAIQYYYGERPPPPCRLDKGKKRAAPECVDVDDRTSIVKISKRKPRSCPRCHRVDCNGAFRSRPCN
ncbi:hypothetical protein H2248_003091 [Termitomyces sp. 'cryptogamus']|nr:hypothetical protein H2248_003091 [Termitomyces sp. 'cryptogamus']